MMTLRQIEVLRAIMVSGTIAGAAKLLNVSAPGISRLMKYTEKSVRVRLFERRHGRYVPTPEALDIFEQLNGVYKKVDDLHFTISRIERGDAQELRIGSVPSIANVMVPLAVRRLRQKHPDLRVSLDILKIEEAIDFLLLGKGEVVAMSYQYSHPSIDFIPLATGELYCIVPEDHELARRRSLTPADIARYPLIGIDPSDPYGAIMAELFTRSALSYDITIRARFGTTVCALVEAGLGIAVIDQFTVARRNPSGIRVIPISEPTVFQTYIALRNDAVLSVYAETFVSCLRAEMKAVAKRSR